MRRYAVTDGVVSSRPESQTIDSRSASRAVPSVSANGATGAIVWVMSLSGSAPDAPSILRAYDATNLASAIYSSPAAGADAAPSASARAVPTIANGKVYVGGQSALGVFGLRPQ
jgi:hypothetical protein